jgi:hypothetical protein
MVVLVAAALLAAAMPAHGQEPRTRSGQWISVGLGVGFDRVGCGICSGTPRIGVTGYAAFGGTLSDRFSLAGALSGWTRSDEEVRQLVGSLLAVLHWYPEPEGPWHFTGGVGAVGYRAEEDGDALTSLSPGLRVGAVFERWVSAGVTLSPFATLTVAPTAKLHFNGEVAASGANVALLQAGLGVTWH